MSGWASDIMYLLHSGSTPSRLADSQCSIVPTDWIPLSTVEFLPPRLNSSSPPSLCNHVELTVQWHGHFRPVKNNENGSKINSARVYCRMFSEVRVSGPPRRQTLWNSESYTIFSEVSFAYHWVQSSSYMSLWAIFLSPSMHGTVYRVVRERCVRGRRGKRGRKVWVCVCVHMCVCVCVCVLVVYVCMGVYMCVLCVYVCTVWLEIFED